ncbi:F0F1 ATP synthase subunit delta [Defluviitalea phaphyphila]|uniref:F0F1 ATP synthase subunit delta n=1 Tax=Defluviitalea phaphyphila TaxID=1473580 RepID=UPI000730044D|nr:F0F1 ATP synthase subunit delta [Defluviitalea phaphyphila]
MEQLIAKRYSKALFDLAIERDTLDEFENQVEIVYQILTNNKEYIQILQNPRVLMEEKIKLIKEAFSSKVLDEIMGLLILVVKKNREEYLLDILNTFLEEVKKYKGIVKAVVISAVPLNSEQISRIREKLTYSLKKNIQIDTQIDPSIIGGLKIRVGDRILDSSIKGKLDSLKTRLYDLQLV